MFIFQTVKVSKRLENSWEFRSSQNCACANEMLFGCFNVCSSRNRRFHMFNYHFCLFNWDHLTKLTEVTCNNLVNTKCKTLWICQRWWPECRAIIFKRLVNKQIETKNRFIEMITACIANVQKRSPHFLYLIFSLATTNSNYASSRAIVITSFVHSNLSHLPLDRRQNTAYAVCIKCKFCRCLFLYFMAAHT